MSRAATRAVRDLQRYIAARIAHLATLRSHWSKL